VAAPRSYTLDLAKGRRAERSPAVQWALERVLGPVVLSPATREDDYTKGIDLWAETAESRRIPVQVKACYVRYNGDIALELVANTATGCPGWTLTTKARLLVIVWYDGDGVDHVAVLNAFMLRAWTKMRRKALMRRTFTTRTLRGSYQYESLFAPVPLEELPRVIVLLPPTRPPETAAPPD